MSEQITNRKWEVQGAYGRWFVEEYRAFDGGRFESGTYGDRIDARSERNAKQIAAALNSAYSQGRVDEYVSLSDRLD